MNKWVLAKYGIHLQDLIIDMAELGYNGLVLEVPDHITELEWAHEFIPPLVAHCEAHNIELIPLMCAVGRLSPYLQKAHPSWQEMKPLTKLFETVFDDNPKYVYRTSDRLHIPATITHSDGKVQVAGCMNELQLQLWYAQQINFVIEHTGCTKIFLSLDEIRAGGTCERCKNKPVQELLVGFIRNIILSFPIMAQDIDFYAWGDMFDPTHNARHPYYHLAGSTEGALDLVLEAHPEFKVVSWGKSTWYVDNYKVNHVKSINIDKEGLLPLPEDDNRLGLMYTTWTGNYSKLREFRDVYWKGVG